MRYLLDTNICIELIRGRSKTVLQHIRQCQLGEVGISTITLAELEYGVAKSSDPARNQIALAEFCAPLEIISFDDHAAAAYGRLRAGLERLGTPIGPLDTLIAAHALAISCVLVTNNEREFQRVNGLPIENWTKP
ncbi:MAG: type II toxin-antitoxin system VapC family toxin [Phycisphaerae bacterium]|nr:type II toxin-antitoxin system VapC family toxin [Phycisphaerae bacterium]